MRTSLLKSRFLQSAAILVATAASVGAAGAATPNVAPSNVDVLNLLSPFLSLNGTTIGTATLWVNLAQAITVNTGATPAEQALAMSDENLLGSASNSLTSYLTGSAVVYGTHYGVAANLAGTIPNAPTVNGVTPSQTAGGYGTVLGAIYDTGVNGYAAGTSTALTNTVSLLTQAYSFTSSSLGIAKNYFANGTYNGSVAAVAPSGLTLPTYNGLPNTTNSVYDIAYGASNTQPGQQPEGDSRPYQVAPSSIDKYDPTYLTTLSANPSFPSGHTTYAFTDSYLLAMLVPEQFQSSLSRAAQFANSRIVLGAHYPLDIIASRSFTAEQLAQALTTPAYIKNAGTTGTAINLPGLFTAAAPELNGYLSSQCGASVASCAASAANANSLSPSLANAQTYAYELNYGLPTLSYAQAPQQQAPAGGPDASILLSTLYGGSTPTAKALANSVTGGTNGFGIDGGLATSTINQIIVNTEGQALAAFYGTSLSYWSRINLYAAAGYFQGVTGTLNTADGDHVTTDVTVASGGVIDVTGLFTVDGNFDVNAGGALGFTLGGLSQIDVGQESDLEGAVDVVLKHGFDLAVGEAFELVAAGQGLTDNVSGLSFDGAACSALGGGLFGCGHNLKLLLSDPAGSLTLQVEAVPEPASWALMLAGFAGLGFAGYRRATSRALG